jgi:hypothetical protein
MSKLMITTQYCENYGTPSEPYWKFKGGSEYFVPNVDECDMVDVIVDRVRPQVEISNPMCEEYILGYEIVADDYMTEFERSQLEYEGKVTYPAKILEIVA